MSFSIDPAHKSPRIRGSRKTAAELLDELEGAQASNLPVPVAPARTIPPRTPVAGSAAIEAQKLGERRGLRAGASVIDQAKVSYTRTEWSGSQDRRAPKGRAAATKI
jgi:hypothetical protein